MSISLENRCAGLGPVMPRWIWFAPLGGLTLILALWAFRLGWIAATITETDVITTYAQKYVVDRAEQSGGDNAAITDCIAYPGAQRGVWIVVSCVPNAREDGQRYTYHVNRFGGLAFSQTPAPYSKTTAPSAQAPET